MADFNPFAVLHLPDNPGRRVQKIHPIVLSLRFGGFVVSLALVVTAIEGTLGSFGDIRLGGDLRRIAGSSHRPGPQGFPLMRDVATWILAAIVVGTMGLVWHQWQVFRCCLSELRDSGVLVERDAPQFGPVSRFCGYSRIARGAGLSVFLDRINAVLRGVSYALAPIAIFSFVLALVLVKSYDVLGIFRLWNVDTSSMTDSAFAQQAYDNWWASDRYTGGSLVYVLVASVGIFVILVQNIVGLAAVYIIGGLRTFCHLGVDWYNKDGNFGWNPLGRAFRTVRWSLGIHGVALTVVFAIVGAGVWPYTVPLLALWLVVIPLYLGIPSVVFRSVGSSAKRHALEASASGPGDIAHASFVVPYVRSASIKPLRVSEYGVYAFFGSILFPVVLTVVQIVATQ